MGREELIEKLHKHHCPVCKDCHIIESVDAYVKEREDELLGEISKNIEDLFSDILKDISYKAFAPNVKKREYARRLSEVINIIDSRRSDGGRGTK